MAVAVATVEFVEACLGGDILFVLQIVRLIKTEAHIQEVGLLQTHVIMFFAQGLLAGQLVMAALVAVNNLMG